MLIIDMEDRMNRFENPELKNHLFGQDFAFDQNVYSPEFIDP